MEYSSTVWIVSILGLTGMGFRREYAGGYGRLVGGDPGQERAACAARELDLLSSAAFASPQKRGARGTPAG